MNRNSFTKFWVAILVVLSLDVIISDSTSAEETMTVDILVSDVLKRNAELKFYQSEIAAAKGERLTAETWANPEISTTIGDKHVSADSQSDDGVAWSASMAQTF